MARPHLRDPHKERLWRKRVAQWRDKGGTIREFCRRQGLAESAFYFWRRELAQRDRESGAQAVKRRLPAGAQNGGKFSSAANASKLRNAPALAAPAGAAATGSFAPFLPVRIRAEPNRAELSPRSPGDVAHQHAGIDLILGGGALVRVRPGFDRQTLADVLAVIGVLHEAPVPKPREARPC